VIARFDDIDGIVDHHCFKLSFHKVSKTTVTFMIIGTRSIGYIQ